MKTSTVIVIGVGAAALVGIYLYRKKNAESAAAASLQPGVQELQPALQQIQQPVAQDQVPINLPATLLQPTSGNTGIVPPAIAASPAPVPTVAPVTTAAIKAGGGVSLIKTFTTGKLTLKGLDNAFILN